jgi:hypothetical protein
VTRHDAAFGILEHEAPRGIAINRPCCPEEYLRIGLAVFNLLAADNGVDAGQKL